MDRELNPFRPGSGLLPPALTGRGQQIEAFNLLIARSTRRIYDRGIMLSGLRGVGKTVLLNHLAGTADQNGWLSIEMEARPPITGNETMVQRFAHELERGLARYSRKYQLKADVIDPIKRLAAAFTASVSLGGAKLEYKPTTSRIEFDLEELIETVCQVLAKKGAALGIFIDEAQDLDRSLLEMLLAVQHRATQRQWPFYLIGAGLPNLPSILADTRSYAERQFSYFTIGALTPDDSADALRRPVQESGAEFTAEALDILVSASNGYPYFLQVYGSEVWNTAPARIFTPDDAFDAVDVGRRALDDGFFPSRWDRATERERAYLRAIAETGEDQPRTASVAAGLGVTLRGASGLRDSTIAKGLVWAPEHGRIAFSVPGMADFIRRQPKD